VRSRDARVGLIAGVAVLGIAVVLVAARWERDRVPGHAYAIPSADHRIVVEVLNGTRRDGLARTATRLLREKGLDVVLFGSADSTAELDSTRVLVRRGEPGAGATVAKALGTGQVSVVTDTLRRVDVTVLLGRDYAPGREIHP